jgi:hypothetical protein
VSPATLIVEPPDIRLATNNTRGGSMAENPFVGSWRIVSYVMEENGEKTYPLGLSPTGYIMYGADGYMSVCLVSSERSRFDVAQWSDGTTSQKAAAFDGTISYAGPYTIGENTVTHHVEAAWFPDMISEENTRAYTFEGNRLRLSIPPVEVDGGVRTGHLIWEKVQAK